MILAKASAHLAQMAVFRLTLDTKEANEFLDQMMNDVIDKVFQRSQENIVQKKIIDEGTLLKSGNINRAPYSKELVYTAPYADTIEFGQEPWYWPSQESLKGWVQRKLGIRDEKQAKRVAFLIARDIHANGRDPRPFLRPAIEATIQDLKRKRI